MTASKKFIFAFALTTSLLLSLITAGNVVFDAAGVFHISSSKFQQFVGSYAVRLQDAEFGLKMPPYERSIKIEIAETANAQCYVTGSSRHMSIGGRNAPQIAKKCDSVMNLAVSGGSFEDLLIFLGIIIDKPNFQKLYIGVDPWTLSRQRGAGWVDFKERYYSAREKFGIDPVSTFAQTDNFFQTIGNAISLDYLIKSVKSYKSGNSNVNNLNIVEHPSKEHQVNSGANTLLSDGTLLYPGSYLEKTPPPDHLVGDGAFGLSSKVFDQVVIQELETVIQKAQDSGIEVIMVLMPYHPKVFSCEHEWVCQVIVVAEGLIRIIANKHGIEVLGSYDPSKVTVTRDDFLDDVHISGDSVERALSLRNSP